MSAPIVIPPGGGELIGDAPDRRVEILSDRDELHATWTRFGPGRAGADPHLHREHTDLFYVLAGELTLMLGPDGDEVVAQAGTLARLPPLVVHGFRNAAAAELRYLNLHAPGRGFADYMRGLRDGRAVPFDQEPPPADGVRPASEAAIGGAVPGRGRSTLHADVDEIAVAEVAGDPGDPAQSLHAHDRHVESLYVLDGELALIVVGGELVAAAGTWIQVPPGAAHAVAFRTAGRHLVLHTPNCGFGALMRELGDDDLGRAAARAGFDQGPVP